MAVRFGERVQNLKEIGEGLQSRLSYIQDVFETETPPCLCSSSYKALRQKLKKRLADCYCLSYDDYIDTLFSGRSETQAFENLKADSSSVFSQLESHYSTLMNVLKYKQQTLAVLRQSSMVMNANGREKLSCDNSVVYSFLDLTSQYWKISLQLCALPYKRELIFMFTLCKTLLQKWDGNIDQKSFSELASYIIAIDTDPLQLISVELSNDESLAKVLFDCLNAVIPLQDSFLSIEKIWTSFDGVKSSSSGFTNINLQRDDALRLLNSDEITSWVGFAVACCPILLHFAMGNMNSESSTRFLQFVDEALSSTILIPIHRSSTVSIHDILGEIINNLDSPLKEPIKHLFHGAAQKAIEKCSKSHKIRRHFLIQELSSISQLIKDQPGLLGPHGIDAFGALSVTRAELLWYFRHLKVFQSYQKHTNDSKLFILKEKAIVQKASHINASVLVNDELVSQLLHLFLDLRALMEKYSTVISQFQLELLKRQDMPEIEYLAALLNMDAKVENESRNSIGKIITSYLTALRESIQVLPDAVSVDKDKGKNHDPYVELQENCRNIHSVIFGKLNSLVRPDSKMTWEQVISSLANKLSFHSRMASSTERQLTKYGSLKALLFYSVELFQILDISLINDQNSQYCLSMIRALTHSTDNQHYMCPEQYDMLRTLALNTADAMMMKISLSLLNLMDQKLIHRIQEKSQLNAEYTSKSKNWRIARVSGNSGSERSRHLAVKANNLIIAGICKAFASIEEKQSMKGVTIWDRRYVPMVWLEKNLYWWLNSRIQNAWGKVEKDEIRNASLIHEMLESERLSFETNSTAEKGKHPNSRSHDQTIQSRKKSSNSIPNSSGILPPSEISANIDCSIDVSTFVGNHSGIDYINITRLVLVQSAGSSTHQPLMKTQPHQIPESALLESKLEFDGNIADQKSNSSVPNIVRAALAYTSSSSPSSWQGPEDSPLGEIIASWLSHRIESCFHEQTTSKAKAAFVDFKRLWFDCNEVASIATCFGQYGLSVVAERLLSTIAFHVKKVKAYLNNARGHLDSLMQKVLSSGDKSLGSEILEAALLIPDCANPNFIESLCIIGNALVLRRTLFQALNGVLENRNPIIHVAMKSMKEKYGTKINENLVRGIGINKLVQRSPDNLIKLGCKEVDVIAANCGWLNPGSDEALMFVLKECIGLTPQDEALWSLLPFAIAGSMVTNSWQKLGPELIVNVDINTQLQKHVISESFAYLMGAVFSYTDKKLVLQQHAFLNLIKASSVIMMSLERDNRAEFKNYPTTEMAELLEAAVESSGLISYQDLEPSLPYFYLCQIKQKLSGNKMPLFE